MFREFKLLKISTKLWMLVILFFVTMVGVNVQEIYARKAQVLAEKQLKTRHLVESAHSLLTHFHNLQKSAGLTEEEARKQAMAALKTLRYEEKEYFWINDLGKPVPKMVMHPTLPSLDGKVLDDAKFNKATSEVLGLAGAPTALQGKNLFVAFNDVVDRAGHGYVTYDWPKPIAGGGTTSELFTKLSYVKKFEPWGWVVGSGIYIDDVDATFWQAVRAQLGLDALLILALGLVSWAIGRGIIGPIDHTAEALESIAAGEGDLTRRLSPEARGSIERLAQGFNSFVEKIERTIIEVSGATRQLAAASGRVSEVAQHTSAGVGEQERETEVVVGAVADMSTRVQAVARSAVGASEAALQADVAAREGKVVVDGTVLSIRALAQDVDNADAMIDGLQKESASIGDIVGVIREIADQTNLLALNAAIEAARAGEQGRGFAVVADEVRTLAQRTRDATQQIQSKIEDLQKGSKHAAEAMAASRDRAHQSVEQAASAGAALQRITGSVSEIKRINAEIASAAQEQSRVAENISGNLAAIKTVSQQTADDSRRTQAATDELATLVGALQGLVDQFKIAAR